VGGFRQSVDCTSAFRLFGRSDHYIEEAEQETRPKLILSPPLSKQDAPYRATVLEPVGKLCSYFPEINNAISKRNKKVRLRFSAPSWPRQRSQHAGADLFARLSLLHSTPTPYALSPRHLHLHHARLLPASHRPSPLQLLDYDAARSKARKLGEKPPADASKLPLAEQEADNAEEIYKIIDEQLRNDLPQILDLRVPYLDPSFECMVR